ncbi:hypothetical protein TNCV_3493991 [Trichonephila clavipes]|nr:hypothetical protein TNCV_3493991 [Trichonephila clavipes]
MHYIETIVVTLPVRELIYIDGRLQMLDVSHAEWILIIDGWKKIVVLFPPKMSLGSSITLQLQKRKDFVSNLGVIDKTLREKLLP